PPPATTARSTPRCRTSCSPPAPPGWVRRSSPCPSGARSSPAGRSDSPGRSRRAPSFRSAGRAGTTAPRHAVRSARWCTSTATATSRSAAAERRAAVSWRRGGSLRGLVEVARREKLHVPFVDENDRVGLLGGPRCNDLRHGERDLADETREAGRQQVVPAQGFRAADAEGGEHGGGHLPPPMGAPTGGRAEVRVLRPLAPSRHS